MPISRGDLLALLLAIGAGVASLVVWNHGTVDLGMTLSFDGERVRVQDVTPDGNAHRNYWYPSAPVIDITTVDGSAVERGEPIGDVVAGGPMGYEELLPWEIYNNQGYPLTTLEPDHRPPVEAVETSRIASIVAAELDPDYGVGLIATLDRAFLEFQLQQSIWTALVGLLLGGVLWRLLAHGLAGEVGRKNSLAVGAAVATPFLILPVVQVGTATGIAAGYLFPAAAALIVGLGLARHHPDTQWVQTGKGASVVAAGLAAVVVLRYLTSPSLTMATGDRGAILILIAAIAFVPALISATAPKRTLRDRAALGSLGLMPAGAATLLAGNTFDATFPVILLGMLAGWLLLPVDSGLAAIGNALDRVRSRTTIARVPRSEPSLVATRDLLTYGLIGVSAFLGLAAPAGGYFGESTLGAWAVVLGIGLAALVGFAVRRGFLGEAWTDAAVPLAAAVGVPVMQANGLSFDSNSPVAALLTSLAALSVAHVLASRHTDAAWGTRLLAASGVVVGLTMLFSLVGALQAGTLLIGFVAVIPGMAVAFADEPDGEPRAITSRLEALAVALTPGIAATMLWPSIGLLLLGAWLVAIVVWRQFTLNPLLGMAQRTQLQRDVAVAAAETERARLAADLHDDALQQLTMLVRTLDESGNTDAANEAREVATKLRSVVGDLRLPILDDLGAGAALEWLVERVEPLAGGPVKLERSDATRPPANVELAVFRVAQEALTNAIKHGKAPIAVRYDVRGDGRVTLAIDDNGPGIGSDAAEEAPGAGHFGLLNMHQRAEQIGALLDVRRWPAGGTRVALEWRPQGS